MGLKVQIKRNVSPKLFGGQTGVITNIHMDLQFVEDLEPDIDGSAWSR